MLMNKDYCEILLEAIDTLLVSKNEQIITTTDANKVEVDNNVIPKIETFSKIVQQVKYALPNTGVTIGPGEKKQYGEINFNEAQLFTKLGLEGYFTLTGLENDEGNFGVELQIITGAKVICLTFDSSEMLMGNLLYVEGLLQKALYDLTGTGKIKKVVASLYNNTVGTLFVDNFNFVLGTDIKEYTAADKTIELSLQGEDNSFTVSDNSKTIYLQWIYGNGDNYNSVTYVNAADCPPEASIRWYRYNFGNINNDSFGGVNWEYLPQFDRAFRVELNDLGRNGSEEQLKVVIITGEGKIIESSNILQLIQKDDNTVINSGWTTKINLLDNTNGIYNYYDYSNQLVQEEAWRANIFRQAECSLISNSISFEQLSNQTQKVVWRIPSGLIDGIFKSGEIYSTFIDQDNKTRYEINLSTLSDNKTEFLKQALLFEYRIKLEKISGLSEDWIECIIVLDNGEKISATHLIQLNLLTNLDSDYVVVNKILNQFGNYQSAITPAVGENKTNYFYIQTRIFDTFGKEMLLKEGSKIELISNQNNIILPDGGGYSEGHVKIYYETPALSQVVIKQTLVIENNNLDTHLIYYSALPTVLNISGKMNQTLINGIKYCGPTYVRYDGLGANPKTNNSPIALLGSNGNKIPLTKIEILPINKTSMPTLKTLSNGDIVLVPKNIYDSNTFVENNICYLQLTCMPFPDTTIVWCQPIPIYQSSFSSSIIDKWDGALTIDEEDNKILIASLAAGYLENGKDFTGVLVGSLGDNNANITKTGVYGFSQGKGVYSFQDDGTATIGAAGAGQLKFDGNMGIIQSGNFDGIYTRSVAEGGEYVTNLQNIGTTGSLFDLTNGYLIANNGAFRGEIEAPKGMVGGWTISSAGLFSMKTSTDDDTKNIVRAGLFVEDMLFGTPTSDGLTNGKSLALTIGMPDRDMSNASEKDWEEKSVYDGERHFSDLVTLPSANLLEHHKVWDLAQPYYVDVNITGLPHPNSIVFNDLYYEDANNTLQTILKQDYQATFKGLKGNIASFYIEWNGNYTDLYNKYYQKTVSQASISWRNTLPNYQVFENGYVYSRFGTLGTYYAKNLYVDNMYPKEGITKSIYIGAYYIDNKIAQPACWLNFQNGILVSTTQDAPLFDTITT